MNFRLPAALDRRRAGKALCAAWLVGLLLLPAITFALGKRQPLLENKQHAPLAQHSIKDLTDPLTFRELDVNALENNPLRQFALDTRARVFTGVFGSSPTPYVVLGKGGWLFGREVLQGCRDRALTAETMLSLRLISEALRTAGKRSAIFVGGSKMLAERGRKPHFKADEFACQQRREDEIDAALERMPGGIPVDYALRARAATGQPVFLRDDSHWNGTGRAIVSRAVVHELLPARNRPNIGVGDPETRWGDIARFAGFSRKERFLNNAAVMPANHRPAKPGTVAYIGDSQMQTSFFNGPRAPGFLVTPGSQLCRWGGSGDPLCQQAISKAHAVAIETVAHDLQRVTAGCFEILNAAVLDVKGQPATLSGRSRMPIGTSGQSTAVVGGVPDVSRLNRVIRLSANTAVSAGMGQQALRGPPALCASPAAIYGQLVLALPAGRKLSDLQLGVSAPAGTTFKADVIDLDGGANGL